MVLASGKNGKAHVLEISNRAVVSKLSMETVSGITNRLDNHESGLNNNAHQISNISGLQSELSSKANVRHSHTVSDVTGLQTALDGKQSVLTGFTGSFSVVTNVDFPGGAVTTKTITVSNGVIVSIV